MKMSIFKADLILGIGLILSLIINQKVILIFIDFIATVPVIWSAFKSVKDKRISVDLLAGIALTVSVIHKEWRSVAFINLMITSARIFEIYIEDRAKKALESLIKLRPEKVKVKLKTKIIEVPISKVAVGDTVVAESGHRIAVDGKVISGSASIDQSSLTGESLPVTKEKGDKVYCSTLNVSGTLLIESIKVGVDTNFEKMIKLVEKAQEDKTGVKSIVEKFASAYILLTMILCLIVFLLSKNTTLILSLLLVTCADDIAVAIPLAYWGAVAMAAKNGIIVKKGIALEILSKIKTIVLDKTGTLTKGQIRVQHVLVFGKINENQIIRLAAEIACVSSHPAAKAIANFAQSKKISFTPMENFKEISGKGILAKKNEHSYILGGLNFLKDQKIFFTKKILTTTNDVKIGGHNLVFLVRDKKIIGLFGLEDQLRENAQDALSSFNKNGVKRIIMLTGDNSTVAKNIAEQLGIHEYTADLLPQGKLQFVENEIKNGEILAFVGDGVNDAASLARADVGIAMGAIGTDAAIEAADVALMDDKLEKINNLINLSKNLKIIVMQNFMIWGTVNLIGLILVFGFKISPQTAASYNFLTDFIPIFNTMRIFRNNGYKI